MKFVLNVCIILLVAFSFSAHADNLAIRWSISDTQKDLWTSGSDACGPDGPVVSFKLIIPPASPLPSVRVLNEGFLELKEAPPGLEPVSDIYCWGQRSVFRGVPYLELLVFPLIKNPGGEGCLMLTSFEAEIEGLPGIDSSAANLAGCDSSGLVGLFVNYWEGCGLGLPEKNATQEDIAYPRHIPEASTPVYRVTVNQDGMVRLTRSYLDGLGVDLSASVPANFHLVSRGVEIPLLVEGQADGTFDPADAIVFYGQKLNIRNRSVWNGGDFTDDNVYLLYGDGIAGSRMQTVNVTPSNPLFPTTTTFVANVVFEQNNALSWADHLRPNGELWYWSPGLYYWVGGGEKNRTITLSLPRPVSSSDNFSVTVVQAGLNNDNHILDAKINSSAYQSRSFSGKTVASLQYTFQQSQLSPSGSNNLTIRIPSSQTVADNQIPDTIAVSYLRTTEADGNALLIEDPGGDRKYMASGFGSAPYILDLSSTDPSTGLFLPKLLAGASFSSGQATFDYADSGSARKCALSSAPGVVSKVEAVTGRNLKDTALGCDFLILTHPDFHPPGSDSAWQSYLSRRNAAFAGAVMAVDIQEVYDNFSYGIFDPTAIKSFLTYAYANWETFPSYMLLVGDGSYDYKNYMADATFKNWVPTMLIEDVTDTSHQGWIASDGYFSDVNDDGYPDISTGRLPVRSNSEFSGVLNKLMAYEDQTKPTPWFKTHLFIADTYSAPWEEEFETFTTSLKTAYASSPYLSLSVYYHDPRYGTGTNADLCAQDIRGYWDDAAIAHFTGHSGWKFWGYTDGILSLTAARGSDLGLLPTITLSPPSAPLPFVVNATCYTTGFAYQGVTNAPLLEAFVNASDRGAVGSAGYTTISYLYEQKIFSSGIYESLFGLPKERISGDAVEYGRFELPSLYSRAVQSLVLLGDPTLKLPFPDVARPLNLSGTPGDRSVTLNWNQPSPAPAGYDVFRSSDGGSNYSKINAVTVTLPTYSDTGLTNNSTYYYYVVSLDSSGFASAPSNTVSAVPLNPNPPAAPTGLKASDLGLGDVLKLSWNASPESDLSLYTLYWGTSNGGPYPSSQTYPKTTTSCQLSGLAAGTQYFFVLTATNTSARESAYSSQAAATPTSSPVAVRVPALITDLMVQRSGSDLVLTWSKPLVDIKGDAVTVASFDIYRITDNAVTSPQTAYNYNLDTVNKTAPNARINVPALSGTLHTYTDTGAVNLASAVTYIVVALDASGNRGPASHNPPASILSLKLQRSGTTSATLLFFDPVTTTTDGNSTNLVAGYRLYGLYPMTSSKDHVSPVNTVPPLNPANLSSPLPSCESGAVYCDSSTSPPILYTVIAVDNRGNTSLY